MTDTALAATAGLGLAVLAVGWLANSAPAAAVGSVLWSLPSARLTADLVARGVRS